MILSVPFKKKYFFLPYSLTRFRDIEFIICMATLEKVCKELNIEFWQIGDYLKEGNDFDFTSLLLYCGYIQACQEKYIKPKYTQTDAILWVEGMPVSETKKFSEGIQELFGKLTKATGEVKEKKKSS